MRITANKFHIVILHIAVMFPEVVWKNTDVHEFHEWLVPIEQGFCLKRINLRSTSPPFSNLSKRNNWETKRFQLNTNLAFYTMNIDGPNCVTSPKCVTVNVKGWFPHAIIITCTVVQCLCVFNCSDGPVLLFITGFALMLW